MTDRELMQQALEALSRSDYLGWQLNIPIIKSLRERLAQPEQEPVATVTSESGNPNVSMSWWHEPALPVGTKLYTATPQRKPLTHPQIHELDWPDGVSFEDILPFVQAIEAAHGIGA